MSIDEIINLLTEINLTVDIVTPEEDVDFIRESIQDIIESLKEIK